MSRPLRIQYPDAWYHAMNPCPLPTKGRAGGVVDEVKRSSQRRNIMKHLLFFLSDSLKEIGKVFEIGKYSTVSSIIERVKKEIRKDKNIKKTC